MSIFSSIGDFIGSGLSAITAPFEAIGDVVGNGIKGLFGQSDMDKYERQLSRNMAYQKEMIDYTNEANLAYNKELTNYNNEQSKNMTEYFYNNYQSPQARMQQFKDAGINPNLAINGSSGLSPVSSSATSGGASAPSSGASYQAQRYQLSSLLTRISAEKKILNSQVQYQKELAREKRIDNQLKLADLLGESSLENINSYGLNYDYDDDKFFNALLGRMSRVNEEASVSQEERVSRRIRARASQQEAYHALEQYNYMIDKKYHPIVENALKAIYDKEISKESLEKVKEEVASLKSKNDFDKNLKYVFDAIDNAPGSDVGNGAMVIKMVLALLYRFSGAE